MYYIVSLSGGVTSAVTADLAIKRYGRNKVVLWYANTLWEDDDLHRFMADCIRRWGGKFIEYVDGRNPMQVAEDLKIVPNQKIAPCTRILKIEPFTKWLWRVPKPVTILMGFDWSEPHRIDQRQHYHKYNGKWRKPTGYPVRVPGVYEDYPLMWKPVTYDPFTYCREVMRIEIPQMYKDGYDHNNCGRRCFRQGIAAWMLTRDIRPDLFDSVAKWELQQRERIDTNHTIIRDQRNGTVTPYPLIELKHRKRVRSKPSDKYQMTFEDNFNCLCGV